MIVRRNEMRASKIMQQRIFSAENIEILWNTETEKLIGEHQLESIITINSKTKEKKVLNVTGFFVAIGHKPNTEIFDSILDLDDSGYIITIPGSSKTKIPGIFATGDAQDRIYRQAVTAAGSGCMGALDAERFLAEKELELAEVPQK